MPTVLFIRGLKAELNRENVYEKVRKEMKDLEVGMNS